jgi:hypothetical protein
MSGQQSLRSHHLPAWALVAAYLVVGLLPRLRFLGAFASPVLFAVGVFA